MRSGSTISPNRWQAAFRGATPYVAPGPPPRPRCSPLPASVPFAGAQDGDDQPVYTVIRRYTLDSPTSQVRAALQRGYIEDACKAPGFIAYFAVEDEDGDFATVAVFRSQEDFENFANAEANWIARNLGDLPAPDESLSGDTYVHAGAAQMFRNTCPSAPQPTAGPAPTTAPGAPTATAAPTAVPATPTPTPEACTGQGASVRPGRGGHVTGDSSAARPPMSPVAWRLPDAGGLLPERVC